MQNALTNAKQNAISRIRASFDVRNNPHRFAVQSALIAEINSAKTVRMVNAILADEFEYGMP